MMNVPVPILLLYLPPSSAQPALRSPPQISLVFPVSVTCSGLRLWVSVKTLENILLTDTIFKNNN